MRYLVFSVSRSNWLTLQLEGQTREGISLVLKAKKIGKVNCSAWRICFLIGLKVLVYPKTSSRERRNSRLDTRWQNMKLYTRRNRKMA